MGKENFQSDSMSSKRAEQPLGGLERFLSVQLAGLYVQFVESVVRKRQKISSLVPMSGMSNHSAVQKKLNSLNRLAKDVLSESLFWYDDNKQYHTTPTGEALYPVAQAIEGSFSPLRHYYENKSGSAKIRVAINAFSYHTYRQIELAMRSLGDGFSFRSEFLTCRSAEIPSVVEMGKADVGLTENFDRPEDTKDLDYVFVGASTLRLMSNFRMPSRTAAADGVPAVDPTDMRSIPLALGDTYSFAEYLSTLQDGTERGKFLTRGRSPAELKSIVDASYTVSHVTSVNLMMDVLLLSSDDVAMIVTPEVAEHLKAMKESNYGASGNLQKREIFEYAINDGGARLNKYAVRRAAPQAQVPEVIQLFWRACGLLARQRRVDAPKSSDGDGNGAQPVATPAG